MTQDKQKPKNPYKEGYDEEFYDVHAAWEQGVASCQPLLAALQQRVKKLKIERQGFIEKIGELLDSNLNLQEQLREHEAENARLKEEINHAELLHSYAITAQIKGEARIAALESQPKSQQVDIKEVLTDLNSRLFKKFWDDDRGFWIQDCDLEEFENKWCKALASQKGETK